jgi:aminomethyltransferase
MILDQLKNGCTKRRVGLKFESGPPARHDVEIYSNGKTIGKITSGCPSPSLGNLNIAMGYIKEEFKKPGTEVELKIRDKFYKAQVTKMPFVPSNYYQKPK